MTILVTGATGFVGGAIARRLLTDGESVRVLVRDASAAAPLAALGAELHTADVGDPNAILRAARGCEALVHAAGIASDRASERALQWVNVAGTENTLNAAARAEVRRFVLVSCADSTLTDASRVHWNEDRETVGPPVGTLAQTKKMAEELVLAARTDAMECCALRAAWVWGPGDLSTLPALCKEGLAGGIELLGDGTTLLSTLYIDNLVDAVVGAIDAGSAVAGRAYYLADSDFLDAGDFFGMLSKACGLPKPRVGGAFVYARATVRERLRAPGAWRADVLRRARSAQFDVGRATAELDWSARVSVPDGMAALAAWVEKLGGPAAVAARGRAPATAESVEAQVRAADVAV